MIAAAGIPVSWKPSLPPITMSTSTKETSSAMSSIRPLSSRGIDSLHHRRHRFLSTSLHPRLLPADLEACVLDQACEPKPDSLHRRAVVLTTSTSSLAFLCPSYTRLCVRYPLLVFRWSQEMEKWHLHLVFGGRILPFSVALTFSTARSVFLFVPSFCERGHEYPNTLMRGCTTTHI